MVKCGEAVSLQFLVPPKQAVDQPVILKYLVNRLHVTEHKEVCAPQVVLLVANPIVKCTDFANKAVEMQLCLSTCLHTHSEQLQFWPIHQQVKQELSGLTQHVKSCKGDLVTGRLHQHKGHPKQQTVYLQENGKTTIVAAED